MIQEIVVGSMEPVSLQQAKDHFRVTNDDDDNYIRDLIRTARQRAEDYTGRSFIHRTITAYFFEFQPKITLNPEPVIQVNSIAYRDSANEWKVMENSNYSTEALPEISFICPPVGMKSPNKRDRILKIIFETGYNNGNPIPHPVKHAILMTARTMYDNREDVVKGQTINAIPHSSEYLLNPYRTFKF